MTQLIELLPYDVVPLPDLSSLVLTFFLSPHISWQTNGTFGPNESRNEAAKCLVRHFSRNV
jgi:hypothetical protein